MCPWERKSICKSPSSQTRIEESRRSVLASRFSGKFMSVQAETLILMIWNLGNVKIVLHQRQRVQVLHLSQVGLLWDTRLLIGSGGG